jgi:phage recombination protein Bet
MTIAPATKPEIAAPPVTEEQLALIKKTVAKDATPDELKLYLYDCARQGVHPLDKLVHFTKRGGKYTPVTSIDFMRIRAADTGECFGISDPVFVGTPKTSDFEAFVTVKRLVQGQIAEFSATARWGEYKPAEDFMWQKMPHTMLGKCAEALALRKGFPKQLAGLYAREEMEQAGAEPKVITEPNVKEVDGQTVSTITGEVVDPAALRVLNVEYEKTAKGRDRWFVYFTDGVKTTTWKEQQAEFAKELHQTQETVVYTTLQATPGKWGFDLKTLERAKAEEAKAAAPDSFDSDAPSLITDDMIPF